MWDLTNPLQTINSSSRFYKQASTWEEVHLETCINHLLGSSYNNVSIVNARAFAKADRFRSVSRRRRVRACRWMRQRSVDVMFGNMRRSGGDSDTSEASADGDWDWWKFRGGSTVALPFYQSHTSLDKQYGTKANATLLICSPLRRNDPSSR